MEALASILVACDYSPCAEYALECAAQLANHTSTPLIVLHVVAAEPPSADPSNLWGSGEDTVKKERERLAERVDSLLTGTGVRYEVEVTWGRPAARIIEIARDRNSHLIVMGTQGMSQRAEHVIGSVAASVVRSAPCAVLTARAPGQVLPTALPPPPPAGAAERAAPTVATVVQQAPITIGQHETLAAAHALMVRHGIHQLPVVEEGILIGILAERDLHAHVGYFERTKVDAAMTRAPITVAPMDSVQQAARILIEQNINALPVVQGGRVLGVVSRTDLLRVLLSLLEPQTV